MMQSEKKDVWAPIFIVPPDVLIIVLGPNETWGSTITQPFFSAPISAVCAIEQKSPRTILLSVL
jgi:hypothetical protein